LPLIRTCDRRLRYIQFEGIDAFEERTVGSSTTSKVCPKSTSRGRRSSAIVWGSIPTAITPCMKGAIQEWLVRPGK
jgi:hypothetical protein